MTTLQFYDPRESEIATIVGQIDHLGIVVLCSLARIFPQAIKAARLSMLLKVADRRKTLDPVLMRLELHGYATHTGSAASESWHITDYGRLIIHALIAASPVASTAALPSAAQPTLQAIVDNSLKDVDNPPGENLRATSSSSSDQILDQSQESEIDQDQSFEEEETRALKEFLCREYGVTGPKRDQIVADDRVSPLWFCAWFGEVKRMERNHFKFRKTPAAYALGCLLKGSGPDEPPAEALHSASLTLHEYRSMFSARHKPDDSADEEEPVEEEEDDQDPQALDLKLFWTAVAECEIDLGGLVQAVKTASIEIVGKTIKLTPTVTVFSNWRRHIEACLSRAMRAIAEDDDWTVTLV